MDDLRTRALLVDYDPASAGPGAIGTVISRDEIATAARGELPATLLLDLDRVEAGNGHEVTAHATVAVEWDEDTLNQLLATTDDEEIALWFDERELSEAFDDSEVEGHGLRQRAAVLAIAVAAAGASTTPAYARFAADPDGGGGSAAAAAAAGTSEPGRGLQVQQIAPTQAASSTGSPAVTSSSSGGLSSGEVTAIAAGAGVVLISAAGFGIARKRMPPVHPA